MVKYHHSQIHHLLKIDHRFGLKMFAKQFQIDILKFVLVRVLNILIENNNVLNKVVQLDWDRFVLDKFS